MPDDLVRLSDIVEVLGLTRSWVVTLVEQPDFPAPAAVGPGVRLWQRGDIERYAVARAERLASRHRPGTANPFGKDRHDRR
jgi:predicted DNA-binding transcriptional regulator AlpA